MSTFATSARLLLMRHAKSSWEDESLDDHDRPLNTRGKNAALLMAAFLQNRGLIPSQIISSSAARAVATAQPMEDLFGAPVVIVPQLYHCSPSVWEGMIGQLKCDGVTLMVGHNPGLEDLVSSIAGDLVRMPTGSVACLRPIEETSTYEVRRLGLESIWRPKELY